MRSRAVRLTLTLLAVGALTAAVYRVWTIDQDAAAASVRARIAEERFSAAARQAWELRAAQRAYVAAGQSEQFWIQRTAEAMAALQETLGVLRASELSATAAASIERASQALDEFARLDRRAREYAASDQRLLASDLIFSDGLDGTQQIVAALDEARAAELMASGAASGQARRELALTAGGAAAALLVALLLLTPAGRPQPVAAEAATPAEPLGLGRLEPAPRAAPRHNAESRTPTPRPTARPETARPSPGRSDAARPDAARPETARPETARSNPGRPDPSPRTTAPMPALQDVADVCAQLAKADDPTALPAVLQRTALALDASGVVLWIIDPQGAELVPVASHGYAPSALAQMGPLPREAENVTAAAFRTGLVQTVKGDPLSNGAIAAPLVNTSGCVGVLSAEVRNDGEREPTRLALATIVAAQLAALTAPAARAESNRAAL